MAVDIFVMRVDMSTPDPYLTPHYTGPWRSAAERGADVSSLPLAASTSSLPGAQRTVSSTDDASDDDDSAGEGELDLLDDEMPEDEEWELLTRHFMDRVVPQAQRTFE
jgi:hypothetical protein